MGQHAWSDVESNQCVYSDSYAERGSAKARATVFYNHVNQIVMELTGIVRVAVTKLPEFPVKSRTSPQQPCNETSLEPT